MKIWVRNNSQTLLRLFGTLLGLGLMIVLLARQGWQEILIALRQVSAWDLALALGLTLLSRLCVVSAIRRRPSRGASASLSRAEGS